MAPPKFDCSLYLVIEEEMSKWPIGQEDRKTPRSFEEVLEASLQGGVTLVQLREKTASTRDFVDLAKKAKALCEKFKVPLLINDRIDVALAVKADGVHVGQDDMDLPEARKLLGPDAIIGVSAKTETEIRRAIEQGANYLGIGPCYFTSTKNVDKKAVLGPRGVARLLDNVPDNVPCVTIGGVNDTNTLRVLHGAVSTKGRPLDGIAVVSAIIANPDPKQASQTLKNIIQDFHSRKAEPVEVFAFENILEGVRNKAGVIHHITNNVVKNDSANMTIAAGGSPIMSSEAKEVAELSPILGALSLNLGTLNDAEVQAMMVAGKAANKNKKPIVLDPVGCGATSMRKSLTSEILNCCQTSILKGNAGELASIAGVTGAQSRGVDSVGKIEKPHELVKELALRERCVVAMTGEIDYVSDGTRTFRIKNGHPFLGKITGSGCMTGSVISCAAAALTVDTPEELIKGRLSGTKMLEAAVTGIGIINVAAEYAAQREDVKGPNTFRAALIDEVHNLTAENLMHRLNVTMIN